MTSRKRNDLELQEAGPSSSPAPSSSSVHSSAGQSSEKQVTKQQTDEAVPEHTWRVILKDFCSKTTLHGFRYFTEPNRHWVERVWWIVSVVAAIVLCSIAIQRIWTKWNEHPVIVSFDNKLTPISKIPFPAVSLCHTKKFHKEKVNITKMQAAFNKTSKENQSAFVDFSPKEFSQLNAIAQMCLLPHLFPPDLVIPSSPSIYETIDNISPFVLSQEQKNKHFSFAADGFCYTTNSLNSHQIYSDGVTTELLTMRDNPNTTHWNREDGYQSNVNESAIYPYRVFSSHSDHNYKCQSTVLYDDTDTFCSRRAIGIHLLLHAPDELPKVQSNFIHIPPKQHVYISVTPNVVTTSNGLRSYDPHERDCYFQSEHQLRFFRSYSEQKCGLECLTNFTRNECGCVHFSMPRVKSTRVCTVLDMECYLEAEQRFNKLHIVNQCDCLPDCFSITYDTEIAQAPYGNYLNEKKVEEYANAFKQDRLRLNSRFFVSFKANHFITINRSESSTMWDFLSSCGSLLGLFMGVSVLSIVEVIYYFTLRLWVNWKHRNKVQPIEETQTVHPQISQSIFEDYCSKSTVHGVRYFTEPKRHWVERVWWVVSVSASLVLFSIVIQRIWTNWKENPVIVSFDDNITSIDKIPFPAVTICPNKKFLNRRTDFHKLVRKAQSMISGHSTIESLSPEEISQYDAIFQTGTHHPRFPSNFSIPSTTLIYDAMRNITLEANSTIQSVDWLNRLNQFEFKPIFTKDGLCYTFNSINSREIYTDVVEPEVLTVRDNPNATHWNRDTGYQPIGDESDQYPYRVFGSDEFDALNVRLGIVVDRFIETKIQMEPLAFKILLNAPDDLPQIENNISFIPAEHDAYISIRPETVTSSNGLRDYSPHARGCYFQSERQLHFFKKYSQQKCRLECLTNFTTKECGCTHFSFPREKKTRICTIFDRDRYRAAMKKYDIEIQRCDCLPDCTSIVYHFENSQVPYHYHDDEKRKQMKKLFNTTGYVVHSRLRISFKENHFISVDRSESSTMSDFLSRCGGLLGLFMGISVISIVELIYFFTLRLGVNWWRQESDRIKAAAARIKSACVAFIRSQWNKIELCMRNFVAFVINQWEKLRERFKCKK